MVFFPERKFVRCQCAKKRQCQSANVPVELPIDGTGVEKRLPFESRGCHHSKPIETVRFIMLTGSGMAAAGEQPPTTAGAGRHCITRVLPGMGVVLTPGQTNAYGSAGRMLQRISHVHSRVRSTHGAGMPRRCRVNRDDTCAATTGRQQRRYG